MQIVEVVKIVEAEKIVEVPQVQVVDKIVEVEKFVEVYAPVELVSTVSSECQACEDIIRAETNLLAPEAVHRQEFQEKINKHKEQYPGGTLPFERRDFDDYMKRAKLRLDYAEQLKLRCLSCGQYQWTQYKQTSEQIDK